MDRQLLYVDLARGQVNAEPLDPGYMVDYIGGSGLAARLLWSSANPERAPLDAGSPLVWLTGPLTGTGGPSTGRFTICGRSPQTGLWGESNIGGFVGPELRQAGYEGLVITGRANAPVYLWIHDGQVELRDASHLWGQADTYETQRILRAELGEPHARVACIGQAGECGVPYALILADHGRVAGRTGMGTLMGAKNLKAVAVRGTGKLPLAQPDQVKQLVQQINKALLEENMTAVFRETGTAGAADYLEMLGDVPQKYWTQAAFEGVSRISGAAMAETILTRKSACQGCVIGCGRVVAVREGPYATSGDVKGPEYETIAAFGSQLLVDDLGIITALGNLCDSLGLDSISAGGAIGLAYLLFDRGAITAADTGGIELRWGDATPCFRLLPQIARREGFGALLAQGARALGEHFGAADLAVQVHNLEVPMHDPRAMTGSALVYVTSPRGACHNQGDYFSVELGGAIERLDIPVTDRFASSGKSGYVAVHQNWRTVCNSLVMCEFASVHFATLVDLLSAATGHEWSLDEMLRAGERAWNLKRLYNLRHGLDRAGERLPRLLLEPLPDGGQEGNVPDVGSLLQEYYAAREWDPATGGPTPAKLQSLGLEFAAL